MPQDLDQPCQITANQDGFRHLPSVIRFCTSSEVAEFYRVWVYEGLPLVRNGKVASSSLKLSKFSSELQFSDRGTRGSLSCDAI